MTRTQHIRASLPLGLLDLAERKGANRDAFKKRAGLPPGQSLTPDDHVPFHVALELWRALLVRFPSDPLALELAESWRPQTLGLVGYLAAHAQTAGEVLESFVTFQSLVDGEERMSYSRSGDRLVVRVLADLRLVPLRAPMEALIASGHAFVQGLVGRPLRALRVAFGHPTSLAPGPYHAFFGIAPEFEADGYEAHYPWSLMAAPVPRADPQLATYLRQVAEEELERQAKVQNGVESLARVVRLRLGQGEAVSLGACARQLGLSERSLQRELSEADSMFREVVEREKRRLAELLLSDSGNHVAEVAQTLGYAESASFSRAFKRWTGRSPAAYRRGLEDA